MKQCPLRRTTLLTLQHLLTMEITRTISLSTIPVYEPSHPTIPCPLTRVQHKFPGSPANVCDNLATGTVWVEYNDVVGIFCMLRLLPFTNIECSVRSTVTTSVSTGYTHVNLSHTDSFILGAYSMDAILTPEERTVA